MNIETCINYFDFLNRTCDRYLKDSRITEEEIHQLKIELDRFVELVEKSDLPLSLRQKISVLQLEYTYYSSHEYLPLLGGWDLTRNRRQRKRNEKVEALKSQIKNLPDFIRLNY